MDQRPKAKNIWIPASLPTNMNFLVVEIKKALCLKVKKFVVVTIIKKQKYHN